MLALYHNGLSSCSQKVRLVLAEKGLAFESREVNLVTGEQHAADYVKLNPSHVVPTLIHDGRVLIESSLIDEYLDEAFPETPLRPADAAGRHAMRLWVKRIDEKVHPAAGTVTYAIVGRAALMLQPPEVREANLASIPDPDRRAARRSVIERGVEAPEFAGALRHFLDLLDAMEASLAPGGWLSGAAFGLADAAARRGLAGPREGAAELRERRHRLGAGARPRALPAPGRRGVAGGRGDRAKRLKQAPAPGGRAFSRLRRPPTPAPRGTSRPPRAAPRAGCATARRPPCSAARDRRTDDRPRR